MQRDSDLKMSTYVLGNELNNIAKLKINYAKDLYFTVQNMLNFHRFFIKTWQKCLAFRDGMW